MNNLSKKFYSVYPNLHQSSIQTFTDDEEKKSQEWFIDERAGIYEYSRECLTLLKQTNTKHDVWVFFSVNSMKPWKRTKKDTTGINTRICEIDNCSKEEQAKKIAGCPLKPSMIIESKNSYHLYWFAQNWTIENYHIIGRWLVEYFNADPVTATDFSRVLRLPWFYHCKDPQDKFQVKVVVLNEIYYTEEQMREAYPRTPPPPPKPREVTSVDWDDFRVVVNSWSAEGMLAKISWTRLVGWQNITFKENSNWTKQIICDWVSTGCRIDKNDTIGSSDRWWPSRTNRVTWYGLYDWSELYEWIKENCQDLLPEKMRDDYNKKPIQVEDTPSSFEQYIEKQEIAWEYGLEGKKDVLWYFYKGDFVILAWQQFSWKTTYAYHLANHNASIWNKVMFFTLEMSKEQILTRLACSKYWVKYYELVERKKSHDKYNRIMQEYERLDKQPNNIMVWLPEQEDRHINKLLATMREQKENWFNFFIIDSLSKIIAPWKSEIEKYDYISREFRLICTNESICIVLIHHMWKPKGKDMSKPRWVWGSRGSHKLVDDCTKFIEYWRDQESEMFCSLSSLIQRKDTLGELAPKKVDLEFDRWDFITV